MALEIYSKYYNSETNRTTVAVTEADPAIFVRFDAELEGNLLEQSDSTLLDRAVSWFTNKYIQEYATQKLEHRLEKAEEERNKRFAQLEKDMQTKIDEAVVELTTMFAGFAEQFGETESEG